ncbi:zinc-binding protein A33-like [Hypanus sabinus]|uniref:zinc-binding protein A33-like n=1 Tax=Hypanus sabinus TaxID=79690 RepID=UPI0028C4A49A|nr:zinc-binding protein A33-like [Hypanus sabinus]
MASKDQVVSITEEAICPICLDFFTDPVSLECGHNFCRHCITQCWKSARRNSCPECRAQFADHTLRSSWALASLSDKVRRLSLSLNEKENKRHCKEHEEELKLFCETDKKLICVICATAREHRAHNLMPVKEATEIYKVQVKSSLDSFMKYKALIQEMEEEQTQKISGFWDLSHSIQSHIRSQFAKLHQILTEKEQRLLRVLMEEEERILDPMEKSLREIQENLNSIEEEISRLQKQMDQNDCVVFLKEEARRKRRVNKDTSVFAVVEGALRAKKFNHPLSTVWRGIVDAVTQVSVALGVETAALQLDVSEDQESASCAGTLRSLPDTGKGITNGPCELGREGFTSGRYYWEVEVAGIQGWCLGVTAESLERSTDVKLIPENGFWTIWQRDDEVYVLRSPPSRLPAGPIPVRVGVYLSYESGTVSFYNMENKSHLYTFTGDKFTGRLYPFFWTWDGNQWLRM